MRVPLGALLLVLAGLTASCSEQPNRPEEGSSPTGSSPSAAPTPGQLSPENLPVIPAVTGSEGALTDADIGRCEVDAGPQLVRGTVSNSAARPRDYVVALSWVTETSDVLARGVAVVEDVAPGEDARFAVRAEVPDGVTQCTRYVVRGEVAP